MSKKNNPTSKLKKGRHNPLLSDIESSKLPKQKNKGKQTPNDKEESDTYLPKNLSQKLLQQVRDQQFEEENDK